jgi:hypothetical protein
MSATIIQDLTENSLTIQAISKAMRVEFHDPSGVSNAVKRTYCAATGSGVGVQAVTNPFFIFEGSATQTIHVQRIRVTGAVIGTIAYNSINLSKHSAVSTGGTAVVLTQVPVDANDTAATASKCSVFTGAPSAGALVGVVASARLLLQSSTAAAGGRIEKVVFDYRLSGESNPLILRGVAQGISLSFAAAPAGPVDLGVEIMWTEE